jgi:hypothetical protein
MYMVLAAILNLGLGAWWISTGSYGMATFHLGMFFLIIQGVK